MARLERVKADAGAPGEVFRLLTEEGEGSRTLAEIARAWRVPKGRFMEWFTTEHGALLDAAERVLGIDMCHAVRRMTDEASEENFALVKFKTDRYLRLAGMLNAQRYSPRVEPAPGGVMPTLVIEIAGVVTAPPAHRVLEHQAPHSGKLLPGELI